MSFSHSYDNTCSENKPFFLVQGPESVQALEIALVHLLFNVLGVLLIFGIPVLRTLPIRAAEGLAVAAVTRRWVVVLYVLGVFFFVPGTLLGISWLL